MVSIEMKAMRKMLIIRGSALMYNHRSERNRVDVVDLDPYGTAAPFIDGAVQCVNDGGLSQRGYIDFCLTESFRSSVCYMHGYVGSCDDELS